MHCWLNNFLLYFLIINIVEPTKHAFIFLQINGLNGSSLNCVINKTLYRYFQQFIDKSRYYFNLIGSYWQRPSQELYSGLGSVDVTGVASSSKRTVIIIIMIKNIFNIIVWFICRILILQLLFICLLYYKTIKKKKKQL